jgi:hypothetical protein
MLKEDIEKDFPFISVVEYGGKEYVGVINNQDHAITSMYIYQDLRSAGDKADFVALCKTWWWESNRMIPIGIFLRKEMQSYKEILMIMNTKDVTVKMGHVTNLSNLAVKRTKRRSVQLVRKPKEVIKKINQ